jgi:integrase
MPADARVYVRQRGPGRFELRAYLGVKSDGAPRFRYEQFRGDEAAAKARGREIEAAMLRGEVEGLSADTLGGFCDRYLARIEAGGDLALSTIRGYRNARQRIRARLGARPLAKLRPRDFETLYLDLLGGLSPVTVGNTHRFLHLALEYAVKLGEIASNPCTGVSPPSGKRRRAASIDDDFDEGGVVATIPRERVFALIASFESPASRWQRRNPMLAALFFAAYATGMRRGELAALSWRAVDLDAGRLAVRRSLYWPYGKVGGAAVEAPVFKAPKSGAGRRTITISASTVAVLARWRAQLEEIAREARAPMPALVFPDLRTLGPARPDWISNAFRTRMIALGFGGTSNIHALRHTHASELLAAREPPHIVSRRLGHADVATTLRIYAHAIPGSDESVAARLDEALGLDARPVEKKRLAV